MLSTAELANSTELRYPKTVRLSLGFDTSHFMPMAGRGRSISTRAAMADRRGALLDEQVRHPKVPGMDLRESRERRLDGESPNKMTAVLLSRHAENKILPGDLCSGSHTKFVDNRVPQSIFCA